MFNVLQNRSLSSLKTNHSSIKICLIFDCNMSETIVFKLAVKGFAAVVNSIPALPVLLRCAFKIVSSQTTIMDYKDLKIEFKDGDSLYAIVYVFDGSTHSIYDVQQVVMEFFSQFYLNLIADADIKAISKACDISFEAAALLLNKEVLKNVYFAKTENIFESILREDLDALTEATTEPILQLGPVLYVGEAADPHRAMFYRNTEDLESNGWTFRFSFRGILSAESSVGNFVEFSNFVEIHIGEAYNPHRMMIFEDRELADRHGWTYVDSVIVSRTPRMGMVPIAVGIAFDPYRCMLTPNCTDHTLDGWFHQTKFFAYETFF